MLEIVALMLAPSAAVWAMIKAWGAFTRGNLPDWLRRRRRADSPAIERLGADLRRLSTEIDRIESSNLPAKVARMRAASLAYDDVLLTACRVLEVPQSKMSPPLEPVERLEAEAALARQGMVW